MMLGFLFFQLPKYFFNFLIRLGFYLRVLCNCSEGSFEVLSFVIVLFIYSLKFISKFNKR